MSGPPPSGEEPSPDDVFLDEALEAFLAELGAGREPDPAPCLAARPDLRAAIAETLALARRTALARPAPRPRVAGHEVLAEIGRGGMGAVYLAADRRTGRRVALKLLPRAWVTGRGRERFLREVRAVARLRHPGVVAVFDAGDDEGTPWFTMEHLEGRTLAAEIARLCATATPDSLGADHVRRAAAIAADVAAALAHAHEHGVVHRDVKPANVMLRDDGRVVLFDFGLAEVEDELTLTREGAFLGTPHYASPEQAAGRRDVDGRTDVWSLGAVLYELLTLRQPFAGTNARDVLRRVESETPAPVAAANSHVPADLAAIVSTALAKDPSRRQPSARALFDELGRFLRGEEVVRPEAAAAGAVGSPRRAAALAALDRATAELRAALADPPLLFAALCSTFARCYTEVDEPGPARELAGEAYAVLERLLGPADPETVRAMATYARSVREAGDLDGGLRIGREALTRAEALREGHPSRLTAELAFATTLGDAGALAEAEAILLRTLAHVPAGAEEDAVLTLRARHALAFLRGAQRRHAESAAMFREIYARRVALLGPDDRETLSAHLCLASQLGMAPDLETGLALSADLIARATAACGATGSLTTMALNNYAAMLADAGRFAEAEACQERAVAAYSSRMGPASHDAATASINLACLIARGGDAGRACETIRPVVERLLASGTPLRGLMLYGVARYCEWRIAAGSLGDAERALVTARRWFEAGPPEARASFSRLAADLERRHRDEKRPDDVARVRAALGPVA